MKWPLFVNNGYVEYLQRAPPQPPISSNTISLDVKGGTAGPRKKALGASAGSRAGGGDFVSSVCPAPRCPSAPVHGALMWATPPTTVRDIRLVSSKAVHSQILSPALSPKCILKPGPSLLHAFYLCRRHRPLPRRPPHSPSWALLLFSRPCNLLPPDPGGSCLPPPSLHGFSFHSDKSHAGSHVESRTTAPVPSLTLASCSPPAPLCSGHAGSVPVY